MTRRPALARLLVLLIATLLALAPAAAAASGSVAPAAVRRPTPRVTVQQIKRKGRTGIRALSVGASAAAGHITGHVAHNGGMWQDAWVEALGFQYVPEVDDWFPVTGSLVASTGAYDIPIPSPGDYRVGFIDAGTVYHDLYYPAAATVASATTIAVALNKTVSGIDATLTPLPENMISGTVSFSGAPAPAGTGLSDDFVGAYALQWDSDFEEWVPTSEGLVAHDGTYRIHLPAAGSYRVGFHDWSGVFSDAFYKDAKTPEEATSVVVPDPAHSATGIDQTMTAIPSRRVAGPDRYGTSVAISKLGFPSGSGASVVLATGENWPDAISGSVLAAYDGGPLLLTRRDSIPATVAAEIMRLQPFEVVIVGGYPAVSLAVEIQLRTEFNLPMVWRLAGRDRYETSALVADQVLSSNGGPGTARKSVAEATPTPPPLVVVSGERFADALSAAPLAGAIFSPLVLTRATSVPPSVSAFLARHKGDISSSVIIGGSSVVSSSTAAAFPTWRRIAGKDRYETASAVASYGMSGFGMRGSAVGVASGMNFPDGLSAAPLLANDGEPLLLTRQDVLSAPTEKFLVDNHTSRVLVFGGEPAVGSQVFERILDILQNEGTVDILQN